MKLKIASRYAFSSQNRHRRSSIRIAIGLLFCTFALNVVISFMIGLQDQRFSSIRQYQSYDAIIDVDNENLDNLYSKLKQENYKVYKFSELPAILKGSGSESVFATIRAFDSNQSEDLPYEMYAGSLSENGLSISYSTALLNNLKLKDDVALTILKKGETIPVVAMKTYSYISGIYSTPLSSFNSAYFLMDRSTMLKMAPYTETKLAVYGDVEKLQQIVGESGVVHTWIEQNQSLYAAMKLEQFLMYLTLSVMSIIVLVNLHSSSKNLLNLKRNEIAMLSVMGMKKRDIVNIFTNQALIISTAGVLSGSILSILFLKNAASIIHLLYRITDGQVPIFSVPLKLDFSLASCLTIAAPILVLTYIMSYFESRRILKKDGMEILNNE
ncbi:MAG: ABC transporter permease [Sphaerochaeta sp.]